MMYQYDMQEGDVPFVYQLRLASNGDFLLDVYDDVKSRIEAAFTEDSPPSKYWREELKIKHYSPSQEADWGFGQLLQWQEPTKVQIELGVCSLRCSLSVIGELPHAAKMEFVTAASANMLTLFYLLRDVRPNELRHRSTAQLFAVQEMNMNPRVHHGFGLHVVVSKQAHDWLSFLPDGREVLAPVTHAMRQAVRLMAQPEEDLAVCDEGEGDFYAELVKGSPRIMTDRLSMGRLERNLSRVRDEDHLPSEGYMLEPNNIGTARAQLICLVGVAALWELARKGIYSTVEGR